MISHISADNIKLSQSKLQCGMSVIFAGMPIGGDDGSYKPASAKAEAINKLEPPKNVSEVRSLLGLLNVFKNFILDFTQLLPSIWGLLKMDSAFI